MKAVTMVTSIVLAGIVAAAVFVGMVSYVTNANYGNRAEKQLEAAWADSENTLAQYSLKIAEMAQVPDMQRDDLSKLYKEAMEGRYGDDGSKAVFQWLQEQNPQLNAEVYTRLQQTMEAGRNEFRVSQTKVIDLKRSYETNLGYIWKGFWLRLAGYPRIDLDKFKVITSDHAEKAFAEGKDEAIKLRP